MLFKLKNKKAEYIPEQQFALEKDLQQLVEENTKEFFGLNFVVSEFIVGDFRIDTVAFDEESKAFMIIEYKKGRNESLVDQGYTYLGLLFDRKADFVLKYNETFNKNAKVNDFDWGQSRVIFVSPKFTDYQIKANDFKNNPIELYQVKRYEGGVVELDVIKKKNDNNSFPTLKDIQVLDDVDKVVEVYTEKEHLSNTSEEMQELYERIKNAINEWGEMSIEPKKFYLAFKGRNNIVDFVFKKNKIKLYVNMKIGELDDPKEIARDISSVGTWGNGDYEITIQDDSELEYILSLVKQSWNKNKK